MTRVKGLPLIKEILVFIYDETKEEYVEEIVKVRKLPLGRAAELSQALDGIPEKLKELRENPQIRGILEGHDLEEMEVNDFVSIVIDFLPVLLNVATDLVTDIITVGSEANKEIISEIGVEEATEILLTIFEVNDLQAIWGNIKKLQQLFKPKTEQN